MAEYCPVCGDPVKETRIEITIGDKKIVVCCRECAEQLQHQPETYVLAD